MSESKSYLEKTFVVESDDARIRKPGSLLEFERYGAGDSLPTGAKIGDFKIIPRNTKVKVDDFKIVPTGASGSILFVDAVSPDGATQYGWTSSRNLKGKFINETLGEVPAAPGTSKFGPNAAWSAGKYLGQVTLVDIWDAELEIARIALDTLNAYFNLVRDAANDGITVAINSGFRSYPEQRALHDGFVRGLPGFNRAAKPGYSKHQNGIAFDIDVAGSSGNPVYDWLKRNAPSRGFVRTVNNEPWHWEYDRKKAAAAVAAHTYKTPNVKA